MLEECSHQSSQRQGHDQTHHTQDKAADRTGNAKDCARCPTDQAGDHWVPACGGTEQPTKTRTGRTLLQSIVSPVISTILYFVVFGAAIGSRITEVEGVSYGTFIVPGLVMLSLLTQSISNASFGIYFPRFTGTIYELLSAPVSTPEIVLGYVGAAATKSIMIGLIMIVRMKTPTMMLVPSSWMM